MIRPIVAVIAFMLVGSFCPVSAQVDPKCSYSVKWTEKVNWTQNNVYSLLSIAEHNIKHTWQLSPEQEALLIPTSLISLELSSYGPKVVQFPLSADPNYEVGDNSISVKTTEIVGSELITSDVKAKWGKGKFTVSAKIRITIDSTTFTKPVRSSVRAPFNPSRDIELIIAVLPGIPPNTFAAYELLYRAKNKITDITLPDGNRTITYQYSLKSNEIKSFSGHAPGL